MMETKMSINVLTEVRWAYNRPNYQQEQTRYLGAYCFHAISKKTYSVYSLEVTAHNTMGLNGYISASNGNTAAPTENRATLKVTKATTTITKRLQRQQNNSNGNRAIPTEKIDSNGNKGTLISDHRLVQANKNKLCQAPNAVATRTYFVSHRPPWTVQEGGKASVFVQDVRRTGYQRKRVPTDNTPSKRSTMLRRFRRKKLFFLLFSEQADSGFPKARLQIKKTCKTSKNWLA